MFSNGSPERTHPASQLGGEAAEGRDSCKTAITNPAAKGNIGPHLRAIPPAEAGHAGAWASPRSPKPYPVAAQMARGETQWKTGEKEGRARCHAVKRQGIEENTLKRDVELELDSSRGAGESVSEPISPAMGLRDVYFSQCNNKRFAH